MENSFEVFLKDLSELKAVIKRLNNPKKKYQNMLQFYDYLALKEVFINIHKGDYKEIEKFELNVKNNNLMFFNLEGNKVKLKKFEKKVKESNYNHQAKSKVFHGNKKINIT